ncbi:MAG: WD40 repeat domain-containing protein [Opitutaceae bacterium]|nr:WD40 repeat domain-containing protein [Opitutaceae bacterium]
MQLTKHWAAQLDDYTIDLAWSPDGTLLAAASAAGPVALLAATDGARRHELPGHEGGTNCLAWRPEAGGGRPEAPDSSLLPTPDSRLLSTGGQDGSVKFWDATAGQHTATAELGRDWVEHLQWVRVGDAAPKKPALSEANGPRSDRAEGGAAPCALLFAAAGKNLFAVRADATLAHTFKPAAKTITALAAPRQGGCIASACYGGVTLWDTDDFLAQKELVYANGIHALVWSPDAKWLVSGNQDPSVHLWIPEQDIELHMSGYETKVKHLTYDHTSRWLATSGGRDCCVWDCSGAGPEGREPAMLPHDAPLSAVSFQNTHGLLATASADGHVRLWSVDRRSPLRATVKMPAPATKLAWSPDDRQLAIGSEKGAVYVLKCEA